MTTDDKTFTDMEEQIVVTLITRGRDFACQIGPIEARALAAAVMPTVRQAQRDAWDAGYSAGEDWGIEYAEARDEHPPRIPPHPDSPYKETLDEQ